MEITRPVCGDLTEHPPHQDMPFDRWCKGCSPEHADVAAMVHGMLKFAAAYRFGGETVPAGTKLLIHPLTLNLMMHFLAPNFADPPWVTRDDPQPSPVPGIPLVVDQSLPRGGWRLVVGGCEGVIRHGVGGN